VSGEIEGTAEEVPAATEAEGVALGTELEYVARPRAVILAERPEEVLAKATQIANSLNSLVNERGLAVDVGRGRKHLEVSAWQALGWLLGALGGEALHAETVWTRRVLDPDGQPVRHRYTAHVKQYYSKKQGGGLKSETTYEVDGFDWEACVEVRTAAGVLVGRAEAMCSRAEGGWGTSDDYAVRSMAETRAESRAYRRAAGWIVAIAGYNPTPAEEMRAQRGEGSSAPPFGSAVSDDMLVKTRSALGYLLSVDPADEAVTGVLRRIDEDAGNTGYLPEIACLAVCRGAAAVKQRLEPGVIDETPGEGEALAADSEVTKPRSAIPAPGSVQPPVLDGQSMGADLAKLREAGCICPDPYAPGGPDGQRPGIDDACPIRGHGIPF
jgi:hypothetical protein